MVPVDAPTQTRKYSAPSATSRKEIPASFARKRSRTAAFGTPGGSSSAELVDSPTMLDVDDADMAEIEAKRRQNTLAARKSRLRKLETQRQLEHDCDVAQRQAQFYREQAEKYYEILRSHNIPVPAMPAPPSSPSL